MESNHLNMNLNPRDLSMIKISREVEHIIAGPLIGHSMGFGNKKTHHNKYIELTEESNGSSFLIGHPLYMAIRLNRSSRSVLTFTISGIRPCL